jgi:heme-degrading monooxygenase HmoA
VILAVSQFRVANGLEAAVVQAFQARPKRVDSAPGFLGLEVFVDDADPTIFSLVTRWTDIESFRAWHSSEEHALSHIGIPKGLRLDAAYTKLTFLREVVPGRDWTELLDQYSRSSAAIYFLVAGDDGSIQTCNPRMAALLRIPEEQPPGLMIWPYLTESDAEVLRRRVSGGSEPESGNLLLNFGPPGQDPHTLECTVSVRAGNFALLGNMPEQQDRELQRELLAINSELSVLVREHARRNKELNATKLALEKTLLDLTTLYWQIRKIREVLPMCLKCGKVQSGEARWDDLADFMMERFPFLSHGYCPDCASLEHAASGQSEPQP